MGPLGNRFSQQLGFRLKPTRFAGTSSNRRPYCANDGKKRASGVDTLALVKRVEADGFTNNQARAISLAIINYADEHVEKLSEKFISKPEFEHTMGLREAKFAERICEIKCIEASQLAILQKERVKLRGDLEQKIKKLRMDIVNRRVDLHASQVAAENGCFNNSRKAIHALSCRMYSLAAKWSAEIQTMRALTEGARHDFIKYCLGAVVSISGFVLGVFRIMPSSTKKVS